MVDGTKAGVETIFMDFIDIIKSPWRKMFRYIRVNHQYEKIFDYDLIPTDEYVDAWSLLRDNPNALFDIGEINYDYDDLLLILINSVKNVWEDDLLVFGGLVNQLKSQKITGNLYIYSPFYDMRIENFINTSYPGSIYVYGDFVQCVLQANPTTFILNDINKFNTLLNLNLEFVKEKSFLISNHDYNFNTTEDGFKLPAIDENFTFDFLDKNHILLNTFTPIKVDTEILDRVVKKPSHVFYDDMEESLYENGRITDDLFLFHLTEVDKLQEMLKEDDEDAEQVSYIAKDDYESEYDEDVE